MLNKLLTTLKDTKHLRIPLDTQRFQFSNLTFGLSARNLRIPAFNLTKVLDPINTKLTTLHPLSSTFPGSNFYESFRLFTSRVKKALNKRNLAYSLGISLVLYFAYEYHPYRTKIVLSYHENEANNSLVSSLTHLYDTHFYPSLYGTRPLLQAIMNTSPPEEPVRYTREPLILPDGGQVALDWALPVKQVNNEGTHLHGRYYPYKAPKDTKILFLIHGLTGGSETNYIQTLVNAAIRKGYRTVVMNQRGVNQSLTTPKPFHGGNLDDLEYSIDHVKKLYPDAPIVALGTSFGGNQLIRHLGTVGEKTKLTAGVLLAAPFDIDDCVDEIQDSVYEKFFISSYFEKNFLPNIDMFEKLTKSHGIDIEQILKVKGLRDYHSLFTVKLYGHKDVREYFSQTKVCDSHVSNVKVPMLVLHARDDPIATHKSIPIDKLKQNPNIIYAETSHGGHLGWFTGFRARRWYSEPTIEYLDKVLELKQQEKKPEKTA